MQLHRRGLAAWLAGVLAMVLGAMLAAASASAAERPTQPSSQQSPQQPSQQSPQQPSQQPSQQLSQQQQLNELPRLWAAAATAGDVDRLVGLYADDAFIHVVFTSDELHGREQISAYYAKYARTPQKVTITEVEESSIVATVGLLSGKALVEFAGQPPMRTRFSIVANWKNDRWWVQIYYASKLDG